MLTCADAPSPTTAVRSTHRVPSLYRGLHTSARSPPDLHQHHLAPLPAPAGGGSGCWLRSLRQPRASFALMSQGRGPSLTVPQEEKRRSSLLSGCKTKLRFLFPRLHLTLTGGGTAAVCAPWRTSPLLPRAVLSSLLPHTACGFHAFFSKGTSFYFTLSSCSCVCTHICQGHCTIYLLIFQVKHLDFKVTQALHFQDSGT